MSKASILEQKVQFLEEKLQHTSSVNDMKWKIAKLEGDVKRLEFMNKDLKKQLHEERAYYSTEKDRFCKEMLQNKKRIVEQRNALRIRAPKPGSLERKTNSATTQENSSTSDVLKSRNFYETSFAEIVALRAENEKLRNIVERTDEYNYELRVDYRRMRLFQHETFSCLTKLNLDFIQALKLFMGRIDEMREEFNMIHSNGFWNKALTSTNAKILEMTQMNYDLLHENSFLRLELQCLQKDINKHLFESRTFQKKCRKGGIKHSYSTHNNEVESKNVAIQTLSFTNELSLTLTGLCEQSENCSEISDSTQRKSLKSPILGFCKPVTKRSSSCPNLISLLREL